MGEKPAGHIMQIQGEPAGGIRRHVHSIIFGLRDVSGLKQSYACAASLGDAGFLRDLPALREALGGRLLDLDISKKPALSDIVNLLRLIRHVKRHQVSLVHGHGAKGGAYARLVAALCGIKAVYTPHGGSVHKMFGWAEDRLYGAAETILFGLTDYFLFESSYTAEAYFAKVGKITKRWKINHNGIPAPDIAVVRRDARALGYSLVERAVLNVGVFGILRPQKGQVYAIKAAALLAAQGVKVQLHFFGKGPDRGALEEEAARLGLGGSVSFHGEVESPGPHMVSMDIILVPSLYEAFGYVAIEAFSLSKPVVASSVGGLKEIITDGVNGFLVEPGNPAVIAEALGRLSASHQLRQELGAKGFECFAGKFTEERMVSCVKAVYAGLSDETV